VISYKAAVSNSSSFFGNSGRVGGVGTPWNALLSQILAVVYMALSA